MLYVNARTILERETADGTEVLLQVRDRPGESGGLEFPGGRLELFEPILDALARSPDAFDWLAQGAIAQYLAWRTM